MLRKEVMFFKDKQQKKEHDVSLQTRLLDCLYASLIEFSEEDPIKNIRSVIAICGEKNLDIHPQEALPLPIKLYRPYEVEQILLPDNANCLATQAYLKMCDINFEVESRWNAEYMSPSAKVPFIKCGAHVVPEFENIVSFISSKYVSLSKDLSPEDKCNLKAYTSLVNNVLYNAELYVCWCHEDTYRTITKGRHGSVYPWPLNHILNWQKRHQITKKLNILGWGTKTLDEVFEEVNKCCEALSERLEDRTYFFGDKPNELDALVFGHIFSIITTSLTKDNPLARIVNHHPKLVKLCRNIEDRYFRHEEE